TSSVPAEPLAQVEGIPPEAIPMSALEDSTDLALAPLLAPPPLPPTLTPNESDNHKAERTTAQIVLEKARRLLGNASASRPTPERHPEAPPDDEDVTETLPLGLSRLAAARRTALLPPAEAAAFEPSPLPEPEPEYPPNLSSPTLEQE